MFKSLSKESVEEIKAAFEKMQTKVELLALLNRAIDLAYPPILRGSFELISLKDFDKVEDFLKPPKADSVPVRNNKNTITSRQLSYFSTSFGEKDKKRKRYTVFYIKKKSGTYREIKAPVWKLKLIQRAVAIILQSVYTVQEQAYGFVPGRSIVDNARQHAGASFILNIDLKDFFPSVYFKRVQKVLELPPFHLSGEKEPLAFMIANLCSEDGVLPQGAPTSPLLTNIICQRLDRRLQEFASVYKTTYTRYADDITFSSNDFVFTKRFKDKLEKILADERFTINQAKTRLQGKGYRQEVTGLTVNEKVNVNRWFLRSYRTMLHLFNKKGAAAALDFHFKRMPENIKLLKGRGNPHDTENYARNVILGKYNFIKMVVGVDNIIPPFELKGKGKKLKIDSVKSIIHLIRDPNLKTETETDKDVIEEAKQKSTENIQMINADVENILQTWENEGFDKAMDLLKENKDGQ